MKLLLCTACDDVFKLAVDKPRSCACGQVTGAYEADGYQAWYSGTSAVPLGFHNHSLSVAVTTRPPDGLGRRFEAFVIPVECPTFTRRDGVSSDALS